MINFIIEQSMIYHLNQAFNKWGIEATEQKIKEIYTQMPKLRDKYLKVYYKLIKQGNKNV